MSRVGGLLARLGVSGDGEACEAVFARVLDGEHLWLAVRGGDGPLTLRSAGETVVVDVDAQPDPHDPSLRSTVVPLTAALAGHDVGEAEVVLTLVAGEGRGAAPVAWAGEVPPSVPGDAGLPEPRTRDRRGQLGVEVDDGVVRVRWASKGPGVGVVGLAALDDAVALHLDTASGTLRAGPHAVEVVDGTAVVGRLPDLPAGTTRLELDGRPLLRTAHAVARPNHAVLLPPLPDEGSELRWLRDGRLSLHRRPRGGS